MDCMGCSWTCTWQLGTWNITEGFSRSRTCSARITGAPMPVFLEGYGESEGIYKIARAPRHPKAMAYGSAMGQNMSKPWYLVVHTKIAGKWMIVDVHGSKWRHWRSLAHALSWWCRILWSSSASSPASRSRGVQILWQLIGAATVRKIDIGIIYTDIYTYTYCIYIYNIEYYIYIYVLLYIIIFIHSLFKTWDPVNSMEQPCHHVTMSDEMASNWGFSYKRSFLKVYALL